MRRGTEAAYIRQLWAVAQNVALTSFCRLIPEICRCADRSREQDTRGGHHAPILFSCVVINDV